MKKIETYAKKYRWILVIIAIIIFSYGDILKWSESRWIELPIITKYESIKDCKILILEQLKSPSTAEFSDINFIFNDKMNSYDYSVDENSDISKRRKSYFGYKSGDNINNTINGGTGQGYSGSIEINGGIDSENSFGAMIRSTFSCEKIQGQNMTSKLIDS